MMFGLVLEMAIAPMFVVRNTSICGVVRPAGYELFGRWSVSGVQWAPPSRVRQMPPLADATKMRFGLVGSAAMPETRPLTFRLPGVEPFVCGAGPTGTQPGVWPKWFSG